MIKIRPATSADAGAIAAIHNQGIEDRVATFETAPRSAADVEGLLVDAGRHPVLVADSGAGSILGWASLGEHSARLCYAGIAEFSIYLERGARGRGLGRVLLGGLIASARELGYWKVVSRVFTVNLASRALCKACGFREVGTYEKHARLDGRWQDVVIVERLIAENLQEDRL